MEQSSRWREEVSVDSWYLHEQITPPTEGGSSLSGVDANQIGFGATGAGAPTKGSRSLGTKIVLYPNIDAGQVDYAVGIESATMWRSVPSTGACQFRWYAGPTSIAALSGTGNLAVTGSITAGGNAAQQGLASGSTA